MSPGGLERQAVVSLANAVVWFAVASVYGSSTWRWHLGCKSYPTGSR